MKTAQNGRGPRGRFVQGNPGGPGRPRGLDFRHVVAEQAELHGVDMETALWRVFQALLERAQDGDVQAAKLLLDRLCGTKVEVEHTGKPDLEDLILMAVARIEAESHQA